MCVCVFPSTCSHVKYEYHCKVHCNNALLWLLFSALACELRGDKTEFTKDDAVSVRSDIHECSALDQTKTPSLVTV